MSIRKGIQTILSLRSGESKTVLLLIGYSFVISIGLYIYYTAATTIFLSNFSNKDLPVAYITGGVLVFIIGKSNLYLQEKVLYATLSKWLVIGLTIFAGILLYIYFIFHSKWIVFALFLLIRANLFVFSFTFWIAASKIFNLEQAKRLFGLLGTGEVIASTLANFLVSFLVSHKISSVDGLLIIAVCCIAASFFFYTIIQNRYSQLLAFKKAPTNNEQKSVFNIFIRETSQYHLFVYLLACLPIVCLYLVEYIFSVDSKAQYPDKEHLATFIGQFLFTCSIIELIVKSFLYRFITDTFGVSSSLILLPASLLAISIIILLLYTADINIFFLVLISRFFITSIRRSFSDTSFQLLYQPLPHSESIYLQNLVEIYIKPFGYILAGGSLLFLTNSGFRNSTDVFSLLLIYLVIWLAIAWLMRQEYKDKIISFLANHKPLLTSTPAQFIASQAATTGEEQPVTDLNELVLLAESPLSADRLKAAARLRHFRFIKTNKLIIKLLKDPSEAVRQAAISAAATTTKPEVWEHVIPNLFIEAYAQATHKALNQIGDPALPLLGAYFKDRTLPASHITALIETITSIGGDQAIHIFRKLLDGQPASVRNQIYKSLLQLGYQATLRERSALLTDIDAIINRYLRTLSTEVILRKHYEPDYAVLLKVISYEREDALDSLLILLSLYYNDDRFLYLKELIQNKNKQSRGYLNEILNILISEDLKGKLIPLFEDTDKEDTLAQLNKYFPQHNFSVIDCLFDLANCSDQEVHLVTKALTIHQMHRFNHEKPALVFAAYATSGSLILAELCLYYLFNLDKDKFDKFNGYFQNQKDAFHLTICERIASGITIHHLETGRIEALVKTDAVPYQSLDYLVQVAENMQPACLKTDDHLFFTDIKKAHADFYGIILTKGRILITPDNNDLFFMDAPNYYLYNKRLVDLKALTDCEIYYMCITDRENNIPIHPEDDGMMNMVKNIAAQS